MSISFGWNPFATAGLAEQLHEAGDTLGFGEVSDLSEALLIPVFLSGDKEESGVFDGPAEFQLGTARQFPRGTPVLLRLKDQLFLKPHWTCRTVHLACRSSKDASSTGALALNLLQGAVASFVGGAIASFVAGLVLRGGF